MIALVRNRFRGDGVYLLDEPETGLSPQRQLALLIELIRLEQHGSQIILATHSPILLGAPGAEILSFDDDGIHPTAYEDTESCRVTKTFVNGRESLLAKLFDT